MQIVTVVRGFVAGAALAVGILLQVTPALANHIINPACQANSCAVGGQVCAVKTTTVSPIYCVNGTCPNNGMACSGGFICGYHLTGWQCACWNGSSWQGNCPNA
jgi:hypothetical protein